MHGSKVPVHKDKIVRTISREHEIFVICGETQKREIVSVVDKMDGGQRWARYLKPRSETADIDSGYEVAVPAHCIGSEGDPRMEGSVEDRVAGRSVPTEHPSRRQQVRICFRRGQNHDGVANSYGGSCDP